MSKFFTISIGNRGSVITLRNKIKVFQEITFESIDDSDSKSKLDELFKKNNKLLIYIILDNVGQNYSKKSVPMVGFFDAMKIINRKFNREIPKNDLKEKRFLGRNKDTKEWEYMFISSPIDGYLQEWLDYLDQTENILNGIYMLPLEFGTILKNIKKKFAVPNKKENNKVKFVSWTTVIIENAISGYREITFANNRLVFTRILQEDFLDNKENFSKYFMENVSQTTEYLKRFYQDFNAEHMEVYTITSLEKKDMIKEVLNDNNSNNIKIKNFSFLDIASIFNLERKKYENSEYGDILFQDLITKNRKTISFSTRDMKQLVFLSRLDNIFVNLNYVSLVCLLLLLLATFFFTVKNKYNVVTANRKLEIAKKMLADKEKENFGSNISNLDEIIDFGSFYTDATASKVNPFDFLIKLSTITNEEFVVNGVKWQKTGFDKSNVKAKTKLFSQLDINLINKSGKMDSLFKVYENVDKTLKTNFTDYNIRIPNLPKNISVNTNYFSFPLKIDFTEK